MLHNKHHPVHYLLVRCTQKFAGHLIEAIIEKNSYVILKLKFFSKANLRKDPGCCHNQYQDKVRPHSEKKGR